MKRILFVLAVTILLIPTSLFAAEERFTEYAPDAWASDRLVTAGIQVPSQPFVPFRNIILTGVDIWADNTGSTQQAIVSIINEEGDILTSKGLNIPNTGLVEGGEKFHITFPEEVTLDADTAYEVVINIDVLGVGLYYADHIKALAHNSSLDPSHNPQPAKLGADEQTFTFKHAIYKKPDPGSGTALPIPEASDPLITNAAVFEITDTSALMSWTTNVPADSRIAIRKQNSPSFIVTETYDPTLELEHNIRVFELEKNTLYFADVSSLLADGETLLTTFALSFQTTNTGGDPFEGEENTPPPSPETESEEAPETPPEETPETPTTPEPDPEEGSSEAESTNEGGESSEPNTESPVVTSSAGTATETNPGASDLPIVTISESETPGGTIISWEENAEEDSRGGYRIDIFDADYNVVRSISVPPGETSIDVQGLSKGKHHIVVYAKDGSGLETKAAAPTTVRLKRSSGDGIGRFTLILIILAVGFVILATLFVLKFKKDKVELPMEEGFNPKDF